MAVTFVIGNAYRISPALFDPGNSIASALANGPGRPVIVRADRTVNLETVVAVLELARGLWRLGSERDDQDPARARRFRGQHPLSSVPAGPESV